MISPLDPRTLLSRPCSDTLTCGPLGQEKSWPLRVLSVLRALSLDRVAIRVCPVTLHDFLVRTNYLHTYFFAGGIDDGSHYMFWDRRIIDYGSHYMPGACQRKSGRPATRRRRPQISSFQGQNHRHFLELGFGGQQLEDVAQKCAKMWRR